MKKYLMTAAAALAFGGLFTSCSHDDITTGNGAIGVVETYERAFTERFGQPAANHTWGFDTLNVKAGTRSQSSPSVPSINAPFDAAWVATYNETAKEPNSQNVGDNYDNTTYAANTGEGGVNSIDWNDPAQVAEREYFYSLAWENAIAWALEHHPSWLTFNADETFVRNFKITGTWNGDINVVATEGLTDGVANNCERTVVVTGTWNITADQRVGSKGRIIIANGGVVNVAEGKKLEMVNQARLVVLPGGKLTGKGAVEVNNGNATGEENYNGGTIDVASFNNNFGKFYNYGKFLVNEYIGGAKESNFYNHNLASIDHFSSTANARIFNACQFYVQHNARIRNYEGVMGSALIVGGQLMFSGSEDGTSDPTTVGLAAGALVKCNTLYNNGTSWAGPTSDGYAVLSIEDKIEFLNWQQDHPDQGGYFANNLYVYSHTWDNVPDGNGYHQTDPSDEYNYSLSIAEYKFKNIVANATGNGNVAVIDKGTTEIIPADTDFELGVKGCTPGFSGDTTPPVDDDTWGDWVRIIVEDLSVQTRTDFDFNDAVFDVRINSAKTKAQIKLKAAGGTLPLTIGWSGADDTSYTDYEVHNMYNVATNVMVNTNARNGVNGKPDVVKTLTGTFNSANDVKVMVQKRGVWMEITAHTGEPASKIQVKPTYEWCNERKNISDIYNGTRYAKSFNDYVSDPSVASDWYE